MKKFLLIPLAIILIAGMCLGTACEKGPEAGSVLRVSLTTFAYETFDPIIGESFFGWSIYDPLLTWDENFEICGAIAKDWTISDDGLTWTFEIRDDVTFWDGVPLTSADVMFSVQHWQDPESTNPWSPYLSYNFDYMECPDDYTYVYKSNEPELALAIIFTDVRILPKDYIETYGIEYFREHPMGSGPWKYVDGSFVSGEKIEFEANTEHWLNVPHFERLIQYVVPEESTQVAMLKRGEVDIITGITLDRIVELRDEGYRLQDPAIPVGAIMCLAGSWMPEAGPTYDIRVRRALGYAIDYQELCDTFFQGFAEPGGRWFMYPGSWGWDDDWEPLVYDLAEAESLLADAGYPDAFDDPVIHIYIQIGTAYTEDLMEILQGYWAEAGIQTEIHVVGVFEWLGMYFMGAVDPEGPNIGAIFPWVFDIAWPNNVYHSYNMYCPGGVHATSNDAHAGELYTKATRETDPDLMEEYWTEFQAYVNDELVITLGVCLVWAPLVVSDKVGDFGYGAWISIADSYCDIKPR